MRTHLNDRLSDGSEKISNYTSLRHSGSLEKGAINCCLTPIVRCELLPLAPELAPEAYPCIIKVTSSENMPPRLQSSKKTKSVKNSSKMVEECPSPIVYLNDDCLLHIFSFISASDALEVESVCRRWQKISLVLWKSFRTFDVTSEQLEYDYDLDHNGMGIDLPICKQVFSNCWNYLTRINLSRVMSFSKIKNLMNIDDDCLTFSPLTQKAMKKQVMDLDNLIQCENIEELWLCSCVIEVNDETLKQLFKNNRKLRSLYLNKYRLFGRCFSHLSIKTLESLLIINCYMQDSKYLNSIIRLASKLHTLNVSSLLGSLKDSPFNRLEIVSPQLMRLNLNDIRQFDCISDIYELKNLMILSLSDTYLNDGILEMIMENCTRLVVLNLTYNPDLTDASLCNIGSLLSSLKYLSIGSNDQFTDTGLLGLLSQNLRVLDVSETSFSEKALVVLIKRMENLEGLDITDCKHLKNSFMQSVIAVVDARTNKISLEVAISKRSMNRSKLKKSRLVQLTDAYKFHYFDESIDLMKYCEN
ncbi:hypothetical protein QAD02_004518 [Eretmocerus hayati]|uniref:Uncharacterized protein n=1 Tax=Eretmocerus hayati TaxID=131215 RepID=A0ACC2NRM4_9HYME|nr:hypothetical protein QAD02_004518 [Eretmocerus hayati]